MDRSRLRGVATVLLAAALLVTLVAPLGAAPPARAAAEARPATDRAGAPTAWPTTRLTARPTARLTAWLTARLADLWPGARPVDGPTAGVQALGGDIDPNGQPGGQSAESCSEASGAPTVTPQLGCVIDPDG